MTDYFYERNPHGSQDNVWSGQSQVLDCLAWCQRDYIFCLIKHANSQFSAKTAEIHNGCVYLIKQSNKTKLTTRKCPFPHDGKIRCIRDSRFVRFTSGTLPHIPFSSDTFFVLKTAISRTKSSLDCSEQNHLLLKKRYSKKECLVVSHPVLSGRLLLPELDEWSVETVSLLR